jgi:hypothetical protein
MIHQFGAIGLKGMVVPLNRLSEDEVGDWRADWEVNSEVPIAAQPIISGLSDLPLGTLQLISPSGQIVNTWHAPVAPAAVWLELQKSLGTPAGMQPMPTCASGLDAPNLELR